MKINKPELFSKVLINVLFISVFISLFFFTYAAKIEEQVVKDQMEFLCINITNMAKLGGKEINQEMIKLINNINPPDLSAEDKKASDNNSNIMKRVIKLVIGFSIFVAIIILGVYSQFGNKSYDLGEIITDNFVILLFIALTEFAFLTFIGAKFISIDPNKTKLSIIQNLKKNKYI
jgi:hypothetical protein